MKIDNDKFKINEKRRNIKLTYSKLNKTIDNKK